MFESVNIYIVSVAVVVLASVALLFVLLKNKSRDDDATDGRSSEKGAGGSDGANTNDSASALANGMAGGSSSDTDIQDGTNRTRRLLALKQGKDPTPEDFRMCS